MNRQGSMRTLEDMKNNHKIMDLERLRAKNQQPARSNLYSSQAHNIPHPLSNKVRHKDLLDLQGSMYNIRNPNFHKAVPIPNKSVRRPEDMFSPNMVPNFVPMNHNDPLLRSRMNLRHTLPKPTRVNKNPFVELPHFSQQSAMRETENSLLAQKHAIPLKKRRPAVSNSAANIHSAANYLGYHAFGSNMKRSALEKKLTQQEALRMASIASVNNIPQSLRKSFATPEKRRGNNKFPIGTAWPQDPLSELKKFGNLEMKMHNELFSNLDKMPRQMIPNPKKQPKSEKFSEYTASNDILEKIETEAKKYTPRKGDGGKKVKRGERKPRGSSSRFARGQAMRNRALEKKISSYSTELLFKKQGELEKKLLNFDKTQGKLIKRKEDEKFVKKGIWFETLKQMNASFKKFYANLEEHKTQMKKLCRDIENYEKKKKTQKKKVLAEIEKKNRKKAKELCRLVNRGFWNKIRKLKMIKSNWKEDETRRKVFKKRLDSFVEKSVNLTSKVARKLADTEESSAISDMSDGNQVKESEADRKALNEQKSLEEFAQEKNKNKPKILPKGNTISSCHVKTPIPPKLKHGTLRDYQRIGLDWLVGMHENGINAILADEMGLGKTIQTISLLAHLLTSEENWGPHLIIVPTSVILNWEIEFKRWLPCLKVVAYYGTPKERKLKRKDWDTPNTFHVLVTSYHLAVTDCKALRRRRWEYLVLDEAHNIKNFQSKKWQTLMGLNTTHRLLLTGTPLQNNVMELWAFLHFIRPDEFASRIEFNQWFDCPMADLAKKNQTMANAPIIKTLHEILRPYMLRRLKKDVAKQLPKKHEKVVKCHLSQRQRRLYEEFMNEAATRDIMSRENLVGMWGVLMQLRKVCNHPDLFESRPILSPLKLPELESKRPAEFLSAVSWLKREPFDRVCLDWMLKIGPESLARKSLERIKPSNEKVRRSYSKTKGRKNSCEDELLALMKDDKYKTGLIWMENSATAKAKEEKKKAKSENSLTKKLSLKPLQNSSRFRKSIIYGENIIRILYIGKKLIAQKECNRKRSQPMPLKEMVKSVKTRSKSAKKTIENFGVISSAAIATPVEKMELEPENLPEPKRKKLSDSAQDADGESLSESLNRITQPFHLAHLRSSMDFPDKRLIQWDCGKLQKLSEMLQQHKKNGDRCLIFTQMSKMLNVLEAFLNIYGYRYYRLDGSTKTDRRGHMMENFNKNPSIFVFILTTRSGGYGINLTGANVVIFYDTDWNPTIDMQAEDRAHRIGQTREVTIYRLISTNTVEENMHKISVNKRKMISAVVGDGKFDTKNLLGKKDIRQMFGMNDENDLEKAEEDEDLGEMLQAAEDEEDQKSLNKAMKEIRESSMTADENAAHLESELNKIEKYALNYESSWISLSGFETQEASQKSNKHIIKTPKKHERFSKESEESELETPDDDSIEEAETPSKTNTSKRKRKTKKGKQKFEPEETEKEDDENGEGREEGKILASNFASLTDEEQEKEIRHYEKLFSRQGFYVHKCLFDPAANDTKEQLDTESFLSATRPGGASDSKKIVKKSVSDNLMYENDRSIGLVKHHFYKEDYVLDTFAFETFFPIESNLTHLKQEVALDLRKIDFAKNSDENSEIDYEWNTCPDQPKHLIYLNDHCIKNLDLKNSLRESLGISNPKATNPNVNRRKTAVQKRTSRRNKTGTNKRIRRLAIVTKPTVIRVPFKYLVKPYPLGWETIKRKRALKKELEATSGFSSQISLNKHGEIVKLENIETQSEPNLLPVLWTVEEDGLLSEAVSRYGYNWEFIKSFLNSLPPFYGHFRAASECQSRYNHIKQIIGDITPEKMSSVKLHEKRKIYLQEKKQEELTKKEEDKNKEPLKQEEPKSVINEMPISIASPKIHVRFQKAVLAVNNYKEATKSALTVRNVSVESPDGKSENASLPKNSGDHQKLPKNLVLQNSSGAYKKPPISMKLSRMAALAHESIMKKRIEKSQTFINGSGVSHDKQSFLINIAKAIISGRSVHTQIIQNFMKYVESLLMVNGTSNLRVFKLRFRHEDYLKMLASNYLKIFIKK